MSGHDVDRQAGLVPVRLRLRPAAARAGPLLDGGWWPQTDEPVRELKSLMPLVDTWGGPVRALSLSAAGWCDHPLHLMFDDRAIPLHWLGLYRNLAIATCVGGRQVRLLVIPPDIRQPVADTAMAVALDPDNHASAPLILVRAFARRLDI